MDNPYKLPNVISLCPGIRGLERGLERAIGRINVVAYVEIEAFIIANLVCAMEEGVLDPAPVWSDVKTFDAKPFRGTVNGIIGGYPCQPFSIAGKQLREADPRHLWPYIERSIKTIQPDWCFFENVANHLNIGYREVRQSLEEMGYAVKEGIYSAKEAGATHNRERLFILAIKLANTSDARCERRLSGGPNTGGVYLDGYPRCGGTSIPQWWPARRGTYQWPEEEPRAVKSGMGCTVDGYNFRTDLLRAYGNAVVEQTAEIAFIDLLKQHYNL